MASRPPSLCVKLLLEALKEVPEWNRLGVGLGMKPFKLREVQMNHPHDAEECKMAMLDIWLRSDVNASWERVAQALEQMEQAPVAMAIREQYGNDLGQVVSFGVHGNPSMQGGRVMADLPQRMACQTSTPASLSLMSGSFGPISHGYSSTPSLRAGFMSPPSSLPPSSSTLTPSPPSLLPSSSFPPSLAPSSTFPSSSSSFYSLPSSLSSLPLRELFQARDMIAGPEGDEEGERAKLVTLVHSLTHWVFDVNLLKDDKGLTLLHHAALKGTLACVKALVAFGADVNSLSDLYGTPLELARLHGNADLIGILEALGGRMREDANGAGPERLPWQPPEGVRMLVLDNSGVMALVQLQILCQIEETLGGRRLIEGFDWVVGSGVGAVLLMAMIYGKRTVTEVRRIYFKLREKVYTSLPGEQRPNQLDQFLLEVFGPDMQMCAVSYPAAPRLIVGAVDKSSTSLKLCLFNNYTSNSSSPAVWKVARYTCSCAMSLGESDSFIDGGALTKNLSGTALTTIQEFYLNSRQEARISSLVSVGDGVYPEHAMKPLGPRRELVSNLQLIDPVETIARLEAIEQLHYSTLTALSEQEHRNTESRCRAQNIPYYRFNPCISEVPLRLEEMETEALVNAVVQTIIGRQVETLSRLQGNSS